MNQPANTMAMPLPLPLAAFLFGRHRRLLFLASRFGRPAGVGHAHRLAVRASRVRVKSLEEIVLDAHDAAAR